MRDICWLLIALNNHAVKYNSNTFASLRLNLSNWIRSLQNPDGSINGGYDNNGPINIQVTEGMIDASNSGTGYANSALWTGADTKPCISSEAWYLLGVLHFNPMALGYAKNINQADKFWVN